mmetsp:Transcript_34718/g.86106  ORF Transcript_34718/g.86106 Transcript_34718/m.86106 type:complete len:308 (+) Transcript_34718:1285-2208(+)
MHHPMTGVVECDGLAALGSLFLEPLEHGRRVVVHEGLDALPAVHKQHRALGLGPLTIEGIIGAAEENMLPEVEVGVGLGVLIGALAVHKLQLDVGRVEDHVDEFPDDGQDGVQHAGDEVADASDGDGCLGQEDTRQYQRVEGLQQVADDRRMTAAEDDHGRRGKGGEVGTDIDEHEFLDEVGVGLLECPRIGRAPVVRHHHHRSTRRVDVIHRVLEHVQHLREVKAPRPINHPSAVGQSHAHTLVAALVVLHCVVPDTLVVGEAVNEKDDGFGAVTRDARPHEGLAVLLQDGGAAGARRHAWNGLIS